MKVIETKLEEVERETDVLCNKCGKSLNVEVSKYKTFSLGLSCLAEGCYRENHDKCQIYNEFDKDYHHNDYIMFDLCRECVYELVKSFKIKPEFHMECGD